MPGDNSINTQSLGETRAYGWWDEERPGTVVCVFWEGEPPKEGPSGSELEVACVPFPGGRDGDSSSRNAVGVAS